MNFNEMYSNAIAQLGETYLTPAYAVAKENFFKVFETLAAAGCIGRVEDCRPELEDPTYHIDEEEVEDMGRMVEILRLVNYPRVNEWEWDYRMAKAQLILAPT